MSKPKRTSGLEGMHPVCTRHKPGLYAVKSAIERTRHNQKPGHGFGDLRNLIIELHNEGFDADFTARQIVDDVYRLGAGDLHLEQHRVEHLVNRVLSSRT